MPYLNETGLAYYNGKLKAWVGDNATQKTVPPALYPWTLSDKAGAVTCWPVGGTPLKPTVDFLFTETPPSNGQPKAPDNPSTITGVSSVTVTRCGKNQFKRPYLSESSSEVTIRQVKFTIDADTGIITVNGTATGGDASFWLVGNTSFFRLEKNQTYSLSGCPSGGSDNTYFLTWTRYNLDGTYGAALSNDTGSGATASYTADWKPIIAIRIKSGVTVSNLVFKPQLELGSTATTFEPYDGTDYTLPLGSTYYGGSIDLAAGVMTVTWEGAAISSFSSAQAKTDTIECATSVPFRHKGNVAATNFSSNRFVSMIGSGDTEHVRQSGSTPSGASGVIFYIAKTRLDISGAADPSSPTNAEWLAAANAWLADNPVFFVGQLFSPYAVPLTPLQLSTLAQAGKYTPRLNTIYTDASSVQVGYVKSPIREEYELQQAIVGLGGNV